MRRGIAFTLALLVLMMLVPAAQASFHLMKIREVYRGDDGAPSRDDAFVELQMYAAGQNLVSGKEIRFYSATGAQVHSFGFPSNAPSGQNQRTILVGDLEVPGGVDFTDTSFSGGTLFPPEGAVCFVDPAPTPDTLIDCVAWGAFTGTLPVGTPAIPGELPDDGPSLTRSISRGCSTLLEASDDTNNSAADFSLTPNPSPRRNNVAPTETACGGGGSDNDPPETEITKAPKNKLRKPKAKYKFVASEADSTFQCAFDKQIKKDKFKPCESPRKYKRLDDGRHKFQVRAIDQAGNVDPTPDRDKFKVVE